MAKTESFTLEKKFIILVFGLVIFNLWFFSDTIIDQIRLFTIFSAVPLNVEFDPNINLADYDASVIISCLHGGACPTGLQFRNDETGEIEQREVTTPKQQPVIGAPQPTSDMFVYDFPTNIQDSIKFADTTAYVIFGIIVAGIIGIFVLYFKKRQQ